MRLNKYLFCIGLLLTCLILTSQVITKSKEYPRGFRKPLDLPSSIAGSFGELRSNHFHSGLDYRTNQREGYPVYAVADGYVSRLRVQAGGFGKAVYIAHPSGYTSVYAHLQRFNDRISQTVKDYQYRRESFEVDFPLIMVEYPVKKGDIIGWSGNTGSSGGPHLHFEIRDSKTEETINPQLFGLEVADQVKPAISALYMYRLNGKPFSEDTKSQYFQVSGSNGNYYLNQFPVINFDQEVGFGISCYDQQVAGGNKNGVYSIELRLDGEAIFEAVLERFAFEDSRAINAHIDYPGLIIHRRTVQKSFVEPGNPLSIYRTAVNRGLISLHDDNIHAMQYIVKDVKGNTSTLNFQVRKNPQAVLVEERSVPTRTFKFSDSSSFQTADLRVIIPQNALYSDLNFKYSSSSAFNPKIYSLIHHVHSRALPLHKPFYLYIKPSRPLPSYLEEKVVVVDTRGACHGGTFENGFVKALPKTLGSFYVSVDTVAPVIRPINIKDGENLSGTKQIVLKMADNLSGIRSYRGTIDGQWVIFDYDAKSATLRHTFEENLGSGKHFLQFTATDMKMNIKTYNAIFYR